MIPRLAIPVDREPDRILVAGDWHGNTRWAQRVIDHLPYLIPEKPRLILQLGDFGIWPGGQSFLEHVSLGLRAKDAHLQFVPGNHEDYDQIESWHWENGMATVPGTDGRIQALARGHRWKWHGRTWLACGGAASPDRAYRQAQMNQMKDPVQVWWPQETITDEDVERCVSGGQADVLVSHDRPGRAWIDLPPWPREWTHQDYARCEGSRQQVQRICEATEPYWVLHGHYHMPFSTVRGDLGYGDVLVSQLGSDGYEDNFRALDVRTMEWVAPGS